MTLPVRLLLLLLPCFAMTARAAPGQPLEPAAVVAGSGSGARLAIDAAGRKLVAWTRFDAGESPATTGSYNVYVRRFAADGTPLGDEQRVNLHEPDYQFRPQLAVADDGAFVVAWLDLRNDFASQQVRARRYGADGQPLGPDFAVSGEPVPQLQSFALGGNGDGRFTVVTESNRLERGPLMFIANSRFTGRNYSAQGELLGTPYRVGGRYGFELAVGYLLIGGAVIGTGASGLAVAVDRDGEIAVAWGGATGGGLLRGYYGLGVDLATTRTALLLRRFDAEGRPRGAGTVVDASLDTAYELPISEAASLVPRLAFGARGDLLLVWQRPVGVARRDGRWIAARRYDAGGRPSTPVLTVTDEALGRGLEPAIAAAADGGFAVAWQRRMAAYSGEVRARAYGADGQPLGPSFTAGDQPADDQAEPDIAIAPGGETLHLLWRDSEALRTRRYRRD